MRGRSRPAASAKQATRPTPQATRPTPQATRPTPQATRPTTHAAPGRPPARGGPTIYDHSTSPMIRSSIVGPPLAGGLHRPCGWPASPLRVACIALAGGLHRPCGWPASHWRLACIALAAGLPGAAWVACPTRRLACPMGRGWPARRGGGGLPDGVWVACLALARVSVNASGADPGGWPARGALCAKPPASPA